MKWQVECGGPVQQVTAEKCQVVMGTLELSTGGVVVALFASGGWNWCKRLDEPAF